MGLVKGMVLPYHTPDKASYVTDPKPTSAASDELIELQSSYFIGGFRLSQLLAFNDHTVLVA